jgi:acetate kinase
VNILVFNCGSSSLTYKIFEVKKYDQISVLLSGKANRVGVHGTESSFLETRFKENININTIPIKNQRVAAALALNTIMNYNISVDYIGHRFVHGGNFFQSSAFLNKETLKKLKLCLPLAPIHNPNSLSVIYECQKLMQNTFQYVAFDSAFHSSLPKHSYTYALPRRIIKKFGFRKYGFHGLSCSYITNQVASTLNIPVEKLKIILCHLGTGGSSVTAIKFGNSFDTSMGYTPLTGLIMSTRCGDIDPMLAIYLMSVYGYRPNDLAEIFSKKSGLLGISGFSSDIRDIIHKLNSEDEGHSELAFNMYTLRIKKYIGSFIVALGGVDVLTFTDDIGIHNWLVREKICTNMEWSGLVLDTKVNRQVSGNQITFLNSNKSKVQILSIPTEEELIICLEGIKLLGEKL